MNNKFGICRGMSLELPSTLVYDYPTAAAISEMIIRQLATRPQGSGSPSRNFAASNTAPALSENVASQGMAVTRALLILSFGRGGRGAKDALCED